VRRDGKIVPIILAAGPSNLGFPKALARFAGTTALQIAVENCAALSAPVIVLGSEAELIRGSIPRGIRVVVNANWRTGQMSSLRAALADVAPDADFLLYPVDYPLLTRATIDRLAAAFRMRSPRHAIAIPQFNGRGGHPVIFAAELRAEFTEAQTARDVVYRYPERVLCVPLETDAIWRDLDSPGAYRARLREFHKNAGQESAVRALPGPKNLRAATSSQVAGPQGRQKPARHFRDGKAAGVRKTSPLGMVEFAELLSDLRAGLPLTRDMALRLIACSNRDLPELLATAVHLKEKFKPGIITYSRKVFLPLTNLCRDYCGYCIFRRDPGQPGAHTMTPEEVLRITREGERQGCREALFSFGDKPELVFPEMRVTLRRFGYKSTLHYLEAMCELVLRETGLIPHANPGLMSAQWLRRLRAVSPSVGLMLESTSDKLMQQPAHRGAPDKVPALRLAVIEAAGRQAIPFTTGILVGIGETPRDRVDSLLAIAELHRRYGHIQEVIVQNFRVKPEIPMARRAEPDMGVMLRTVAVARLILRDINLQAPPNLSAPNYHELLAAGINDWGGISPLTPDFINPERPWPHLRELEQRTRAAGFELRQRLPVYPEFLGKVASAGGLAAERIRAASDGEGFASIPRSMANLATA
jgi:7,8-didemethyl-8-hydroxy-5-deazariboflavin synthase CofG subunit